MLILESTSLTSCGSGTELKGLDGDLCACSETEEVENAEIDSLGALMFPRSKLRATDHLILYQCNVLKFCKKMEVLKISANIAIHDVMQ